MNLTLQKSLKSSNKQQWSASYKYKLIKAINTKYPFVKEQLYNKTKKRFLPNHTYENIRNEDF